jgi:hypothetical protein
MATMMILLVDTLCKQCQFNHSSKKDIWIEDSQMSESNIASNQSSFRSNIVTFNMVSNDTKIQNNIRKKIDVKKVIDWFLIFRSEELMILRVNFVGQSSL